MILNGDQYPPANIGLPTFISQPVIHDVLYSKLRNRERIYPDPLQNSGYFCRSQFLGWIFIVDENFFPRKRD